MSMTDLRERFNQCVKSGFYLDPEDLPSITDYLLQHKRMEEHEVIQTVEKPGEGNMNCVLRVITNRRSFILKQARPWVEKYPQIDAPIQRLQVEADYYELIHQFPALTDRSPKVLWMDEGAFLLALEDLGDSSDFTELYRQPNLLSLEHLTMLVDYLEHLHLLRPNTFPHNLEMRQLNHEHIFHLPFQPENGIDLDNFTPGLSEAAADLIGDDRLKDKIIRLGEEYLSQDHHTLLHGDYYPGSWLQAGQKIFIIDPEFSFVGPPEFDLAVMIAHLQLAMVPQSIITNVPRFYSRWSDLNSPQIAAFAGTEILRRLLGVAQLPLSLDLATKTLLMQRARDWVMGEDVPWQDLATHVH